MFRTGQKLSAVLRVQREGQEKPYFRRLGKAWINVSQEHERPYISVRLDAVPIGGEFQLYLDDPKADKEDAFPPKE